MTVVSFDMVAQREKLGISDEEFSQLHESEFSYGSINVLREYFKLDKDNPIRVAIDNAMDAAEADIKAEIDSFPYEENPSINIVTGAPGTGKSHMSSRLLEQTNSAYICGDNLKKKFPHYIKDEMKDIDTEHHLVKALMDASQIHQLTSATNWELFDYAVEQRKSIVLEMIGASPEQDADMVSDLVSRGYKASMHHVYSSPEKSVYAAVHRRFDPDSPDYGRGVRLTDIVKLNMKAESSFLGTVKELIDRKVDCSVFSYDNTNWDMKLEASGNSMTTNGLKLINHLEVSFDTDEFGTKPWFKGRNHTSDLILVREHEGEMQIALIKRGRPPFEGYYAFPGGFVNTSAKKDEEFRMDIETPEQAAMRESIEEMGLLEKDFDGSELLPVGVFDDIQRDPRNVPGNENDPGRYVVSHPFVYRHDGEISNINGSDDAESAQWVSLDDVVKENIVLAFDHHLILEKAMDMYPASFATNSQDDQLGQG